jgi:hypothetical protein
MTRHPNPSLMLIRDVITTTELLPASPPSPKYPLAIPITRPTLPLAGSARRVVGVRLVVGVPLRTMRRKRLRPGTARQADPAAAGVHPAVGRVTMTVHARHRRPRGCVLPAFLASAADAPVTGRIVACHADDGVRLIEGVTVDTAGLSRVDRRRATDGPPLVLSGSNELQMERIDAQPIPAEVVDLHASRDRSVDRRPGRAMDADAFITGAVGTDRPVAVYVSTSQPQPTVGKSATLDVLPQSDFRGSDCPCH